MTGDQIARLAYLVLLGVAVGGWLAVDLRNRLGPTLRNLLSWCLIFLGTIAGYGLWEDVRDQLAPRQMVVAGGARVEIPRGFDGHYHVTLEANGVPVDFVVDTGATDIVLTHADAARIGIDTARLAYIGRADTANGQVRTAPAVIGALALGGQTDRNVKAVVNEGDMEGSLLGMRYLQRFSRLEISGNRMILER